jgi:hypothetical protein
MKTLTPLFCILLTTASQVGGQNGRSVSLQRFCPTPAEQGVLPASAAHALCQALTIQRNIYLGRKDSLSFSGSWLFNSLKHGKDCEKGVRLSEAIRFLEKKGVCYTSVYPNRRYDCEAPPVVADKYLFRITGSRRLFNLKAEGAEKIETVKTALEHSQPVVAVIAINLGFDALASAAGDWRLAPLLLEEPVQYEAFVITGYDDRTRTFEMMGSYGANWGNGGFARIGFEDFGKVVRYALVLDMQRFD